MRSRTLLMLVSALLLTGVPVRASVITFDEVSAPCLFGSTAPLTDLYAGQGVHFQGPASGQGGAILNTCGNFGIVPHSGSNFLAFNDLVYATDPETITFDSPQTDVSIFAGKFFSTTTFTMLVFNSLNVLVGTSMVSPSSGLYGLLSVSAPDIRTVTLDSACVGCAWVYDDLSFAANPTSVPEPTSLLLLGTGGLGLLAKIRRREKQDETKV